MSPLRGEPPGPKRMAGRLLCIPRRSWRGSLLLLSVLFVSLALAFVAYGSALHGSDALRGRGSDQAQTGGRGIRLGGHAIGLYPGSVQRLNVHVDNLGGRAVTVRAVEVEVGDATSRCSARNISIAPYRGRLRVGAHRRRWLSLRVSMRPGAANACQRARFPLSYRAQVAR